MAYQAIVFRVLIASPSDVAEARDAVVRALQSWNDDHSRSRGVVLSPWMWETSAVPELGGHPQQLINKQGVDDSDIVIALFGSRIGAPTPDAISGTVEEVTRAQEAGKPVHVYFSTGPRPHDVDTEQLDALRLFQKEMQGRGILGAFSTADQLGGLVRKAIDHDLSEMSLEKLPAIDRNSGVDFLVQLQSERELAGQSRAGNPRYRTRQWLDVTNRGRRDAEDVTFESLTDGLVLVGPTGPTVIHKDQTRSLHVLRTLSASGAGQLRITWWEDGQEHSEDFHF